MQARRAFAVAVCVRPDVLLLDEVLAVGDQAFRDRCLAHLRRYYREGGTLIVVSHDHATVRTLCTRGMWLDGGRVRRDGPFSEVMSEYETSLQ